MDQKKWKKAAGALAAVTVLGAGSAGVYAYQAGIQFQPSGDSRELQVNQVQFSQDESAKQEGAQNSDDNAWWKDDQADNSQNGYQAKDQADFLFEDTKQMPNAVRPSVVLNQGGISDSSAASGDSGIGGATDQGGYDISGDRDTADIVIKGDTGIPDGTGNGGSAEDGTGTGKDDVTGGNTNGNQGNNGNTGDNTGGNTGENGGNGGSSGDDTPTIRPADSAKDPEVTKPRPSVSGNYEAIKDGNLSKDDENLYVYIGPTMSDTTALYRGQTVDAYRIFCALDTYVLRRNTESVYYWGEEAYGKYIRITGVSFDGGETWSSDWPVTIPDSDDAASIQIRTEYRFSTEDEWQENVSNYLLKETRLFVLNRKLTEENETIDADTILNSWEQYPNVGSMVYLLNMQGYMLPYGEQKSLFPGWEEDGKPVPWQYQVKAGRHILEPMEMVPLPEGYTVQRQYAWMDENGVINGGFRYYITLQTLKAVDESAIKEQDGERVLTVPEYVQAVIPEGDISADRVEIPDTVLYMEDIDQYLHVQNAYQVSEDNPVYCSLEGVLLNKEQTSILDIPYAVETLRLPEKIVDAKIPLKNQIRQVLFDAEVAENLPDISYDRLSDCGFVVKDAILDDFLLVNGEKISGNGRYVTSEEHPDVTYTVENNAAISNTGMLYKALGTKGSSLLLPADVESIGANAFSDAAKVTTLVLGADMEPVFEKDCFADSNLRTIVCSTPDQVQTIKKQLESCGAEGIRVQLTALSDDGFRYYQYTEDGKTRTIVMSAAHDVTSFDGTIENGTIPVTAVGDCAFADCENLQWAIMNESVKEIGYRAFQNCTALEGVLIDSRDTVTIGNEAFDGCDHLRAIASNAPEAVMEDDYDPYVSLHHEDLNIRISSFYVPEGAIGYGFNATTFVEGTGIASYAFLDLGAEGKMLYAMDDTGAPWLALRSGLTVPDHVELPADTIEVWHFAMAETSSASGSFTVNWEDLDRLAALDVGAFYDSDLSGYVTLGEEGTDGGFFLQDYAFGQCAAVQSVHVNRELVQLGEYVFLNCVKLQRVDFHTFRNGCYLSPGIFNGCDSLTEIELHDNTPPDLIIYGTTPFQFNYNWTTEEEEQHLSLIIPKNEECAEAFVKKWRYLFAGYIYTPSEAPYYAMWSKIKAALIDWETWEEPADEVVDAAVEEQLLAAENRIRTMIHVRTVSEPSDFYPFREHNGMLTLLGTPSCALRVDLDPSNLEIPEGWCLDYIGTGAFGRSKQLQEAFIPDSMAGMEQEPFAGAAEESDTLTVHFAGTTPLTLMGVSKDTPYSFGVADEKLHFVVPDGCQEAYVEAWTFPLLGYEDMWCMISDVWQELEADGVDVLSDEGWAQLESEVKNRLLPAENRMRGLLGMELITDVNDLITYPSADTLQLQEELETQMAGNLTEENGLQDDSTVGESVENPEANADKGADIGTDSDADKGTDADTDSDADKGTDVDADKNADADIDSDADKDADIGTDGGTDNDEDASAGSNTDAAEDPGATGNREKGIDAKSVETDTRSVNHAEEGETGR